MGYFDDLTVLNISNSTMYGSTRLSDICTNCHYLGVMQGEVYLAELLEKRPFVYMTPRNITTLNGWNSPPGHSRSNFYIEFTGERADRIIKSFDAFHKPRIYPVSDPLPFTAKLTEAQRFFTAGTPDAKIRLILCIEEFAALLENELHNQRNVISSRCGIDRIVKKINSAPGETYSWQQQADSAGLSLRHWNRLFTAFTGLPPGEYLADCRLKLARKLLSDSDLPIKEIAPCCGFAHPADFIRFFKKHTGISPGCFRSHRLL